MPPRHYHWGCAILSFLCGGFSLAVVLVILFFAIPALDTSGQLPARTPKPTSVLEADITSALKADIETKNLQTKRLVDRMYARQQQDPGCTMDFLVLSGGGEHGAFGAGFLMGWSTVAAGANALPRFDGITGVSVGSYIAPFAYLGTPEALETINHFFCNPQPDWALRRGMFFFQPENASFSTVAGLERDLKAQMTVEFARQIDKASTPGRLLFIQATNIDEGIPRVFNFATAARKAVATGDPLMMSEIVLASSAIPALFPPREIDGSLYVDGSVGGNFYTGGRASEAQNTFGAIWKREHPNAPIPTTRYWVVLNGILRPSPETVQPRWPAIAERAVYLGMTSAEIVALRKLYALAELTRLRGDGNVEVRWVALPVDFHATDANGGFFDKAAMRAISEEGKRLGADPGSWMTTSP